MLEDNNKRKGLGRGLGALLGDNLDNFLNDNGKTDKEQTLKITHLVTSPYQPRVEFNKEALESLAQSIREKGVLQPLLVRNKGDGTYEIIAGERRFRASKMAGLTEVPAIVKQMSDKEVLEVALVENLLRENLSAIEEAEGLQRLIDEFSHTQEALSQVIGKSRSYIANTLRLLSLPASVQQMVREDVLSAGHVRPFIGMQNAEELIKKVAAKGLNARQAEQLAARAKLPADKQARQDRDVDIKDIERNLMKKLGLKIKISPLRAGGGKVTLQYRSIADLDRIVDILERQNIQKPSKLTMDIIE